jgi:hypothetical protein
MKGYILSSVGVGTMPHDVFISYVEEDRAHAIQTCDVLELAGIHCWIAPRDIAPGRTWGAAIIEAITQCRVMVLIFSSRTNLSRQVARELERADSKRIRVVPFRIENAAPSGDLEFFLGSIQWVDAFEGPFDSHLAQLSRTLHSLLEEIGSPDRPQRDDAEDERSEPRVEERALMQRFQNVCPWQSQLSWWRWFAWPTRRDCEPLWRLTKSSPSPHRMSVPRDFNWSFPQRRWSTTSCPTDVED